VDYSDVITNGVGFPVLVIPGIQGRWEWMKPTIEALKAGHRVITASLQEIRPEQDRDATFAAWTPAIDQLLDQAHERRVAVIGISFGGLIAARYAARRPERVSSLILASTPSPNWHLRPDDRFCVRWPYLSLPYFGARGLVRLLPELIKSRDSWHDRFQLGSEYLKRVADAPIEPRRMAAWVREFQKYDLAAECGQITAPTLIVTGESAMDRVVPVWESKKYLKLIDGAVHQVLPGTGHVGVITRPYRFAEMAGQFIHNARALAQAKAAMADEAATAAARAKRAG
jgi:3-oxoadipate enol-lactonase